MACLNHSSFKFSFAVLDILMAVHPVCVYALCSFVDKYGCKSAMYTHRYL